VKVKRKALLRVTGPNYVAGAVFEKVGDGCWRLDRCAPILGWMNGKGITAIWEGLKKRKLQWEWTRLT
jgi:hypothetical protein